MPELAIPEKAEMKQMQFFTPKLAVFLAWILVLGLLQGCLSTSVKEDSSALKVRRPASKKTSMPGQQKNRLKSLILTPAQEPPVKRKHRCRRSTISPWPAGSPRGKTAFENRRRQKPRNDRKRPKLLKARRKLASLKLVKPQ